MRLRPGQFLERRCDGRIFKADVFEKSEREAEFVFRHVDRDKRNVFGELALLERRKRLCSTGEPSTAANWSFKFRLKKALP